MGFFFGGAGTCYFFRISVTTSWIMAFFNDDGEKGKKGEGEVKKIFEGGLSGSSKNFFVPINSSHHDLFP